jgi:hypothetical protein
LGLMILEWLWSGWLLWLCKKFNDQCLKPREYVQK